MCLVLALGMTGCDDDDDDDTASVPDLEVEQLVAGIAPVVISATTVVAVLGGVLTTFPSLSSASTGVAGELTCPAGLQTCPVALDPDPTSVLCTGGGSAESCIGPTAPQFLDLSQCQNDIAGVVLDGASAAVQTGSMTFCLNMDVQPVGDPATATLVGTTVFERVQPGATCVESLNDLDLTSDGTMLNLFGTTLGCDDGTLFGTPFVTVPDLGVQMEFEFLGTTAVVTVNTLVLHEFIAHCIIEPDLDSDPVCNFSPPR
jgi:hypothetical protein